MASSNNDHDQVKGAGLFQRLRGKIVKFGLMLKKLGQDDPRRIVHSLKVALALTLISMLFYFEPLYDGFGIAAMWAILTVVVVFEFTVGATIGRGLNRIMSTVVAAALGIGAHRLATLSGNQGEPILIGLFVFVEAGIVTFFRFIPQMKARYDYGLLIFNLTFCLISVSGYRDEEVIRLGFERVSTIIIGSCTAVTVCVFIRPVWIGAELHNQIATNMEKLANFLEEFGDEYFTVSENGQIRGKSSSLQGYKSVLASKGSEDTMANLARWEPGHGRFKFHHPWKQYLKVGTLTRQCAFKIEALNNYLTSETQTPQEVKSIIQGPSVVISSECGKALKQLATSMRKMTKSSSNDPHIANSKDAAEELKAVIRSSLCKLPAADSLHIIQEGAVASLLFEIIRCTEKIADAVHKLASQAHFNDVKPTVTPNQENSVNDGPHHVIAIE
ncbi:putative aluminum-activated malate transporter [Rosa chinensis]|uniref:Putative aluminum-activated malate transporter n=1 Tax=Rosa chinensis TaxID=74649 RepID=A0A2P6QEL7_ROSCH|nr:aluminum-activated malate transporter 2 [Rosa chinensis]PRQ32620.1 putative aluminum-activated malate transporter [Rosa chinensis]